jgi:3-methyladenine DNA glycosylase AlkD
MGGPVCGLGALRQLGSGPVFGMVHDRPERFSELVKWAGSENVWRRRTALYALHDFVLAEELDKPFVLLEELLYDEEFWVQRAVGTWLRECWKKDRERTERFLLEHVKGMPKVVITVATERAPRSFRVKLRQLR